MIIQIDNVLISSDILTENFCCALSKCKGACCIEGDAGAPVTLEEIDMLEENIESVRHDMSVPAQLVVEAQGVACTDKDGDLVTSIVNGKDCVFTCYGDIDDFGGQGKIHHCCLCALEKAYRAGKTRFCKPMSCALYPIRVKEFSNHLVGLNYNKWSICQCARDKGNELNLPVYRFLKGPLTQRFGEEWYRELEALAQNLAEATTGDT